MSFFDSRITDIFIGATDYKSYVTAIRNIPGERALDNVTTLNDTGRKSIPGLQNANPSLDVLFDDSTADAALATLRTSATGQALTYWPEGDGLNTRGYGIGSLFASDFNYTTQVGNAVAGTVALQSDQVIEPIIGLLAKVTNSSTGNFASIDDSSSSSNGGAFYYHVFANTATGGNAQWEIILQDSTDDAVFATFASATLGNGVTGSARVTASGTFNRYVRARRVLDATSGSITWVAGYIRN